MTDRVVIVGGGHAGVTLAALLRQSGYDGEVMVMSAEDDAPYHRPPLSKNLHEPEAEQPLRPDHFWSDHDIVLRLGTVVDRIDRVRHEVVEVGGRRVGYDHLVLATGAVPRSLDVPGAELEGVLTLRTLGHARELRGFLAQPGCRLVVVGGGYIGLEVAAMAVGAGAEVTILEREQRVLARVASAELSAFLTEHHRAAGTTIVTGVEVTCFEGSDGRVTSVVLGDGTSVDCDVVLVGIGALPLDDLAVSAGLQCSEGILVDNSARTDDPSIMAIGDVTRRPVGMLPGRSRLESIPSSTEQARQACSVIMGSAPPPSEVPWFWSDQGDLKIKIAGVVRAGDSVVLRNDPAVGRFAAYHHADGIVTAAETVNSSGDFMAAKKLIGSAMVIDPTLLANTATSPAQAIVTQPQVRA
ncbi:NAD(P)/FAD-dependent oxidoreductase [Rhodococcus qingshengii]|uniref:NAD(P)/FAD-dependent oxidoreductase n=1 Tax=Rhodococcus qingshengii TaxID=334542 RepID=UPI002108D48D|nr:FAD-dependent oxidoreductase [Rhodococcus qingshengii]MCQ4152111.1 FAD-dependent oxidoreductase [Rhodococcus qingshengii]MDJ0441237.1 FAD-dependent oxidoreductase [Rhodococcus qingshengii]